MSNRLALFLAGLALALVGNLSVPSRAHAQDVVVEGQSTFRRFGTVPSLLEPTKGAQTGVFTNTSVITSQLIPLGSNPTFSFTMLGTVAAGTVEVHVLLWTETSTAGVYSSCGVVDKVTLTASASTTTEVVNGVTYYPALEILDYATRGATHAELRTVGVPSGGGSVRYKTWAHAVYPAGR